MDLIKESNKHSVTYGINRPSPLLQIENFDITKCLPFDVMHTVYEGVVPYHLNLLLCYLIDSCQYFTLVQLNYTIKTHPYGYSESDTKPSPISRDTSGSKFNMKASGKCIYSICVHYYSYAHNYSTLNLHTHIYPYVRTVLMCTWFKYIFIYS